MPDTRNKDLDKSNKDNNEEYGVVLKNKKYRRLIYPQKGKKPPKDENSYKIV
jgi:hypothetical protein